MKTDWHKYNLKRRVAELPLISSEVFAEKVLLLQQQKEENQGNEDELGFYVYHRKRPGKGERQLTKKEMKQIAKRQMRSVMAERKDLEEIDVEEDDEPVELVRCASPTASVTSDFSEFSLGDSVHLSEAESNFDTGSEIHYSDTTHSDWDSMRGSEDDSSDEDDSDYSDEEEIVDVLPNHFCFYCGENNRELERNIRHMSNHHGLYIPERSYLVDLDGLLTYMNEVITIDHECLTCGYVGKSVESIRQHMRSKGHCRLPYESADEREAVSEFYDFSNEEIIVPRVKKKAKRAKTVSFLEPSPEAGDENSEYDSDPDYQTSTIETTLVLPSGSKVGHRSMLRYYRQNLPGARQYSDSEKTVALVDRRFAPGLTSGQVTKQEREVQKLEIKAKNYHERRTKSSRVNFKKHFRDELLGPM